MRSTITRRQLAIAGAALLILTGSAAAYWHFRPDPQQIQLAKLEEQFKVLRSEETLSLPPQKQLEMMEQFRKESQSLPPEQRRKVEEWGRQWFKGVMDKYYELPEEQREAYLDAWIDRFEAMRQERERAREERAAQKAAAGDDAAPAGTQPGASGEAKGAAGKGRWNSLTPEEREKRRRDMLDRTTPEERARFADFMLKIGARRVARGLPPMRFLGR